MRKMRKEKAVGKDKIKRARSEKKENYQRKEEYWTLKKEKGDDARGCHALPQKKEPGSEMERKSPNKVPQVVEQQQQQKTSPRPLKCVPVEATSLYCFSTIKPQHKV